MINKHDKKFYVQEIDAKGNLLNTPKSLEDNFVGLLYGKFLGLNDIGKPRIYTETYAEKSGIRAYVPDTITNDSTKLSLTLYFTGADRQNTFRAFNDYIRNGRHRYWDEYRELELDFIVSSNIKVSTEKWYDSVPYIQATYTLQNLNGNTKTHTK